MLDDDHLYATRDVEFAFRVWKVRSVFVFILVNCVVLG